MSAGDAAGEALARDLYARYLEHAKSADAALDELARAAAAWVLAGYYPGETVDLVHRAELLERSGRLTEADRALLEAQGSRGALISTVTHAQVLIEQARSVRWHVGLSESIALFHQALSLLEQTPDSPELPRCLAALATVEELDGDLTNAWEHALRAAEMQHRRAPGTAVEASALQALSRVAARRGDREATDHYLDQALTVLRQGKPQPEVLAGLLINIATACSTEGRFAEAEQRFQEALGLLQPLPAPPPGMDAIVLEDLGLVRGRQKRFAEEKQLLLQALAIFQRTNPVSIRMAKVLENLAVACDDLQQIQEAEERWTASLAMWEEVAPRNPSHAIALEGYAQHLAKAGNLMGAVRRAEEAWALYRPRTQGVEGYTEREGLTSGIQAPAAAVVAGILAEAGQERRALEVIEESRAGALRQALEQRRDRPTGIPDGVWQRFETARTAHQAAEAQLALASDAAVRAAALNDGRRPATETEPPLRKAGEAALEARLTETQAWKEVRRASSRAVESEFSPDLEEAERAAGKGTSFAYFSVSDEQVLLFLLSPQPGGGAPELRRYRLPLSSEELKTSVTEVQSSIHAQRSDAVALSKQLCRTLFPADALKRLLLGRRLVIIPDGPLWKLSFAALVLPASPNRIGGKVGYLGLERPLCTVSSLALFHRTEQLRSVALSNQTPRALVVGDPDYGGKANRLAVASPIRGAAAALPEPTPLPGTRIDAERIAHLYRSVPLLGKAATAAEVQAALPDADVVHLAAHGYTHPQWWGASRIYLASRGEAEPTSLQAWEVSSKLTLHADLVVLAACDTDLGTIVPGEGADGLTRAFLRAGAHSVVASHWQVRDDSTITLMQAFHQDICRGLAKDEALRHAMAVTAARPGWEHPFFWAGFALNGDRGNRLFRPSSRPPERGETRATGRK